MLTPLRWLKWWWPEFRHNSFLHFRLEKENKIKLFNNMHHTYIHTTQVIRSHNFWRKYFFFSINSIKTTLICETPLHVHMYGMYVCTHISLTYCSIIERAGKNSFCNWELAFMCLLLASISIWWVWATFKDVTKFSRTSIIKKNMISVFVWFLII